MLFVGSEMERIGCWGWKEGDMSCGGQEEKMELVV